MTLLLPRLARIGTLALTAATLLLTTADAPRPVHAAGMVVNTLADAVPPANDGLCSLREAMTNANTNAATHPDCPAGAGADTITFSVSGTIFVAATLPEVLDETGMVLDGAGRSITLSGGHTRRLLTIAATGRATLTSVTFVGGSSMTEAGCFALSFGQAGGGAVCNRGRLTVIDSHFSDNWSQGYRGGAIASFGELAVEGSTFARNFDGSVGGGAGGAIYSLGPLTIRGSEFTGNFVRESGGGGAIYAEGSLTIAGSTFLANTAFGAGGAVKQKGVNSISVSGSFFAGNSSGTGGAIDMVGVDSSIHSTTFVGNSAVGWGGAVNHGSLGTVSNSTISGNTAGEDGGGMALGGPVTIVNSTITGNTSGKQGGGIISGALTMKNSILGGNSSPVGPDCAGQPPSLMGPNLLSSLSGCNPTGTPPIVGAPFLAALADNGGPTKTHALLPGSPALNAADPTICAAAPVGGVDQRGVLRPSASCDLGAYEASPVGGRNLRIRAEAGQVTLGWDSGTDQTGYTLLTYNTATASTSLASLPAHAVANTHAGATNGVLYCYVLAATGPSGLLGLSDLECALPGAQSGAAIAGDFTLSLHGTANASLTWQSPTSGVESYLLVRIPLDGTAPTNVPLPGATTASTQPLPAAGACFQLVAYQSTAHGVTNVLCGVPGVSTLGARGRVASLTDAERLLADQTVALSTVAGHMRPMLSP